MKQLTIDKELKSYLPPLDEDTKDLLESSIKATGGATEPLVVWTRRGDLPPVIVDGYNRYEICTRLQLPYKVEEREFADVSAVRLFMLERQLSRRNLTPLALKTLRGNYYKLLAKNPTENLNRKSDGGPQKSTADKVGEKFGVTGRTIKRDKAFAEGIEAIRKSEGDTKASDILTGKAAVNVADVEAVGKAKTDVEKNKAVKKAVADKPVTVEKAAPIPKGEKLKPKQPATITVSREEYDLTSKIIDAARLCFTGSTEQTRESAFETLARLVGKLDQAEYKVPVKDAPAKAEKTKPTPSVSKMAASVTSKYDD